MPNCPYVDAAPCLVDLLLLHPSVMRTAYHTCAGSVISRAAPRWTTSLHGRVVGQTWVAESMERLSSGVAWRRRAIRAVYGVHTVATYMTEHF